MPIITISRGSLSGGELLAKQLGSKLGFQVISRELIVQTAQAYGVTEGRLLEEMERPPGLWARLTHQKDRYIKAMRATLAELIEDDNVIYHGHAGRFLLDGLPNVINLRLVAPDEYRLRSATIEHSLSRDEARKYIASLDLQRAQWVRRIYDADWADPDLYDLVINLGQIGIERAAEIVAAMAEDETYASSPESDQQLKDFALKNRIVAALTFRSPFSADVVNVDVRGGKVDLSGGDAFHRKKAEVLRFVRSIQGVKELSLLPDGDGSSVLPREETAADVMLPISNYPQVPHWLTIREAIAALTTSSIQLRDGHEILPRYVLVTDAQNRLVGIIGRRDLLKGLSIQLRTIEHAQRELLSVTSAPDLSFSTSFRWISFFDHTTVECAKEPVRSIMAPVHGTVRPDQGLSIVVTTMIQNGIDLIPVMDGDRAVGVVPMTDVFDRVAQYVLEHDLG